MRAELSKNGNDNVALELVGNQNEVMSDRDRSYL
jgi:hypothetical protein